MKISFFCVFFVLKNIVFIFQILDRLYTAEEAAKILVNDDNDGEMGSADSLDETSSSDTEFTSESEIRSNSDDALTLVILTVK